MPSPYSFLVTNLLTGEIVNEVEMQAFHWNERFNRPGSGSGTARIDTASRTDFDAWRNGFWVRQGDEIVYGGFLGGVAPVSGTRVINVPVRGFMEYFRYRLLRNWGGMSYAELLSGQMRWVNKDIFLIARDMIEHAKHSPNGDIGVDVVWDALSSTTTTLTYYGYEHKFVGTAFEQLADNVKGFNWRYKYSWVDSKPHCDILLTPLGRHRRTEFRLEYDHNPGHKNIQSFDQGSGDPPVNGVAAVGQGSGVSALRVYVGNTNTGYPTYEDLISYKDVSRRETLEGHARKHQRTIPRQNVVIRLDPNMEPRHTELAMGDQVYVKANDGWVECDGWYYVISKEMLFTKEMDLEFKVELSPTI